VKVKVKRVIFLFDCQTWGIPKNGTGAILFQRCFMKKNLKSGQKKLKEKNKKCEK
jgi:hypothetical protein